jgi:TRAP-type transport system periplasmic protein
MGDKKAMKGFNCDVLFQQQNPTKGGSTMKKLGVKATVVFFAVFLLALIPVVNAPAQQKPMEINFGHIWPPGSPQHEVYAQWAQRVEKGSNGRVKITLYPGNTLCPPTEIWNGIKSGAVHIGSTFANYHRAGFELNNSHLFFWIGGPPSIEFALKTMDRMREKYPVLMKEFGDAKILWMGCQGARQLLTSKKPVRTIDDLKNMIIRPANPPEVQIVKNFGGVAPSFMPMGEVYTSLQKGIIEALWVSVEVLKSFRLAEVVKYVTRMNFEVGQNKYIAMNWEVWKKLPPDVQAVFEKEAAWAKWEDVKVWMQGDEDAEKFAKGMGVQFIDLSPAEKAKMMRVVAPIQDAEAAKLDAKGYPATALLRDIRQAIAEAK